MDNQPKLRLPYIVIALVIFLLAAAFYQSYQKGYINLNNTSFKLPQPANEQTRVVVNEENAIISVVDSTSPSVVAIGVDRVNNLNPFDPFSQSQDGNSNNTIGTGFIVSDKGIIVTNKHVVSSGNQKYTVITKDNKKLDVQRIYRDPSLDLALVQVNASDLKALEIGDSSKLKVGQTVIAIGNALGQLTNSVTTGIVSGLGRKVVAGDVFGGSEESLDNLIQTDAAINPGNSGGPLLNSAGQVIGVNVATTQGAQNIGFAIPINSVKAIVDEFVAKGTVSRPFLGVNYKFVTRDLAILNNIPQGAYVQELVPNSAAEKAGIEQGDIITKINGAAVNSETSISDTISKAQVGQTISIEIWRDGQTKTLSATLQDLPAQ